MIRPLRTKLSKENLTYMGIPPKFHGMTLEKDFNTFDTEYLENVKDFVSNYIKDLVYHLECDRMGICMLGSNGVGKTMLSCLIMKEVYRNRYSARRVTFVDYISRYTDIWGAESAHIKEDLESEFYNKYKAVDFLVLEEVGKEIDSKIATPILEDLLRYREDHGLVTCICSNLRPEDIKEKYGESVYSLIQGNLIPCIIESKDIRKRNVRK